jgi:hypothetical protein
MLDFNFSVSSLRGYRHYICIGMKGELLFIISDSIGFPSLVYVSMNMMPLV